MNQSIPPRESGYQARVRSGNIRLARWTGAWVAATALMAFGPVFLWNRAWLFTLLAAALNVAAGVGMIVANKKVLAELDELQRKIYDNALAVTVGIAVIVGIPYSLLHLYDVVPFHAEIPHFVTLMGLTFFVSILYGSRRYR